MIERAVAPYIVAQMAGAQPRPEPPPAAPLHREYDALAPDPLAHLSLHSQRTMLVGTVAGGYIHDLAVALMAIDLCAFAAASAIPPEHTARGDLETLRGACHTAQALSARLLNFLQRRPPDLQVVDLGRAIETSLPLLRALVGHTTRVTAAIAPGACPVLADPVQIDQVLLNLLINARNAMPDGGSVRIEVCNTHVGAGNELEPGEYVRLTVSDTGRGMGPETLARLFEPFYSGQQPGEGVGLGLATCRYIVGLLGGWIGVESAIGGGTTFTVLLPRATAAR